ncbi:Phosphomethylpyrimidine kinase-domain-containing protein [Cristinia sonorae]|uniref:Phosphomethylpyrimidine kinase-domain-containing protein n=1 Tax=Cristinia sonorae TaxID=1940300 RepID=A0A8K0UN63_9AGAR|nr:Phosphomethylpyrimidine kinase-domain-containing protein [Cristinia sonorae]
MIMTEPLPATGQPAVLTIAGTDSSGGAGIQADLKTFTAHGCYGASVVTALTAQNTTGVQGVHPIPPDFIQQQIRSVVEDVDIRGIKTGMLFDTDVIHAIVESLSAHYRTSIPSLVVDPVCVSTSGHTLLQPDAIDSMVKELFPLATLITPNKSEAELILSLNETATPIHGLSDMLSAVKKLLECGPQAVLLKGGHVTTTLNDVESVAAINADVKIVRGGLLDENMEILQVAEQDLSQLPLVVDVLYDGTSTTLFVRPRIDSTSTHGTGCTLSAAIVCELVRGHDLVEAVRLATQYTHLGIETAEKIGSGHGPLNHLHPITERLIPRPTTSVPHPFIRTLIQSNATIWKAYVQHDFVVQLAKGTLDRACFLHFIRQDYLYLKYYARVYGLLIAKSTTFSAIEDATKIIMNVIQEVVNHKAFCAQWGISEQELEATPESPATTAYGAYMMDTGLRGDASALLMAIAACLLGYGEVGLWLKKEAAKPDTWVVLEGNPYVKWIESYAGEDYQNAVKTGVALLENMAVQDPPTPARFAEWCNIWGRCTALEKGFWDMAMNLL